MKVLPAVPILALLAIASACGEVERDDTGAIQTAGELDAFGMRVGDCFDDTVFGADEVTDVPGVPCAEPHDNEVYALFDLDGGEWPGDERVTELADGGCLKRFEAAIGQSYEESVLAFTTLTPSEGSWTRMEDREVVCIAFHMEYDKLNGSVLGSGM